MIGYTTGFGKKPETDPVRRRNIEIANDNRAFIKNLKHVRVDASAGAQLFSNVDKLDQRSNPKLARCTVSVINGDTFDVAEAMAPKLDMDKSLIGPCLDGVLNYPFLESNGPQVVCLNIANAFRPGGGYLTGATAQEEVLCRRSSLYECLLAFKFPIPQKSLLYHKTVLVFRDGDLSMKVDNGRTKKNLPVFAVISAATIDKPALTQSNGKQTYAEQEDYTSQLMLCQAILRVAAKNKHRRLVLGALGCGAFYHPQEEAAKIWAEVLSRPEFRGWFEQVTFAVLSRGTPTPGDPSFNFTAFSNELEGLLVGEKGAKQTQPRASRYARLDVEMSNQEEVHVPRSRAALRARSMSRAAASVEPAQKRASSKTRSSSRLREQSRSRAASVGCHYSPRRSAGAGPGRRGPYVAYGARQDRGPAYKLLVLILVMSVAFLAVNLFDICRGMLYRVILERQRL